MVSFKKVALAGEHTPDRFIEYEHANLYDIADKDVVVKDFEIFESKNVDKYNNDNTKGVIILIHVIGDDKDYTVVTHAKSLVRTFVNIKKRKISEGFDEEIIQFHLGEVSVNNETYPQWQII